MNAPRSDRRRSRAALSASVAVLATLLSAAASAQDLTPDGAQTQDPNGPPPMPPPMPAPGQPGSVAPPPAAGTTEAHLNQSQAEDNGIGLKLFYVQPEIGLGWATLGGAIPSPQSSMIDYSKYRTGAGPTFGIGAGAEFITFQIGGRLRMLSTSNYNLWNLGGEVMIQPGSGRFWPRFGVAVGYAWANAWKDELCSGACGLLDVSGVTVGARGGFQYYVSKTVEIGLDATADLLFLKRDSINAVNSPPAFAQESSGTGVAIAALGHIGVHLP